MNHNKKRNTAFLYEALVKEYTKSVIRSDDKVRNVIASILKEHFNSKSVLYRELNIYKELCSVNSVNRISAEKIISEAKRVYFSFNEQEIFDEQTSVLKKINTDLTPNVFKNFVSNYKTLATISQMFDDKTTIQNKVLLEEKLIEHMMTLPEHVETLKPIDNLTYKVFVNKFNQKYGNELNESQKTLLSKYIVLSPETVTDFKIYVVDEIDRLKESVKGLNSNKIINMNEDLSAKNKEILNVLEGFRQQEVNDNMIKKILKIQSLVAEV